MKQTNLPPEQTPGPEQRTSSREFPVPVKLQEFRRLHNLARTPHDFLNLASVCHQQGEFCRLQSERFFSAQSPDCQQMAAYYCELAEHWNSLADACLEHVRQA